MQQAELPDKRWFGARDWISDSLCALSFITVLPIGNRAPHSRAMRALPLAGAVTGIAGAMVMAGALAIGLQPLIAALLATAGLVVLGGGLHEDGLADSADGFGGGTDAAHKLAIMRDSSIGSYGAIALILALMARVVLAAEIADGGGAATAGAALVASGALSRAAISIILCRLPPARQDGLGAAFASPGPAILWQALAAALLVAGVVLVFSSGMAAFIAALAGTGLATLTVARLAVRQIGGQTGDVCGAVQQAAEVSALLGCVIVM